MDQKTVRVDKLVIPQGITTYPPVIIGYIMQM